MADIMHAKKLRFGFQLLIALPEATLLADE
jgi:hypothetical protein